MNQSPFFTFLARQRIALQSLLAVAVAAAMLTVAPCAFADTIQKVVVTGEVSPIGYSLGYIGAPLSISDASQVAFEGDSSIYSGSKSIYRAYAAVGQKGPGGSYFSSFYTGSFRQNKKGDAVFAARVGYTNGVFKDGIFLKLNGVYHALAFEGANAPGGGTFKDFFLVSYRAPRLSDNGQVAFFANTTGTGAPGNGLYLARIVNGAPHVQKVALVNDPAPDGGTFTGIVEGFWSSDIWSINSAGEIVFPAKTSLADYEQLYCWKNGAVHLIPGTQFIGYFVLNNAGQIAFLGEDANGRDALCLATTEGQSFQPVVVSGDVMPDGNKVLGFGNRDYISLNEAGEIAFGASIDFGPTFDDNGSAFYVYSPLGVRTVAVSGPAPGGGLFENLNWERPILANNGTVYFVMDVAPSYDTRLFKHDKTTLSAVLTVGDPLAGDIVDDIIVNDSVRETANQQPVNEHGELPFLVKFKTYSKRGIFVVTPPPLPPVITSADSIRALVGQRFTYAIRASNFPTQYAAVLHGSAKLPPGWTINPKGVITGIPAATGPFVIDLHAANAGGSGDAQLTITVADVAGYKGTFSGLAAGAAHNASDTGLIKVTIGAKATFTAAGTFRGVAFSAGGQIQPDGKIVFKTKTGQTVRLQLDLAQAHPSISATIEDASIPPNVIATFAVDVTPIQTSSTLAGAYTFILPPDLAPAAGAVYPAAAGFGTIKVVATGGVTLTTYLADNSLPFVAKGSLTGDGKFRFALPKRAGTFLAGDFTLEEGAGDSVTGSVIWQRAGQTAASQIVVQGSRYRPPTDAGTVLTGSLSFRATGGGITDPAPQSITLSTAADRPPNAIQFTAGGTLKKAAVVAASGMFTGTFGAAVPTLPKEGSFTFRGVFLQKQNRAEGFFKGPAGAGTVTLQQ